MVQVYPQALGSFFVASYDSQGYCGGIVTLPQPGGPGPRGYIPQEQDGSGIPSGNGFLFRRLLRLTGLLWRYCNSPPIPNLEGQVPVHISLRNRMVQVYPQALGSLFVACYDSQGYCGGIASLPNLEGQVPVHISLRNRMVQVYPRALGCREGSFGKWETCSLFPLCFETRCSSPPFHCDVNMTT
jgi:hypothetical protein